jgi:hypothetical protein
MGFSLCSLALSELPLLWNFMEHCTPTAMQPDGKKNALMPAKMP